MSKIKLDSFKCEIEVPGEIDYKYEGEQDSLILYGLKFGIKNKALIYLPVLISEVVVSSLHGVKRAGVCYVVESNSGKKIIRTMISKGHSEFVATYVKGHEETHALIEAGGKSYLEKILKENNLAGKLFKNAKFSSNCSQEDIADVGGQLALYLSYGEAGLKLNL